VIGISLDDYFKDKTLAGRKEARAAEGVKGVKVTADDLTKEYNATKVVNQYLKGSVAPVTTKEKALLGF